MMSWRSLLSLLSLCIHTEALLWTPPVAGGLDVLSRQDFLLSASSTLFLSAAVPPPPRSGVDVGGGIDLLAEPQLSTKDVVFPPSMEGLWNCERVVTVAEGDSFAAETIWKSLGGGRKKFQEPESFLTRFIPSRIIADDFVVTDRGIAGDKYVVTDRGYEIVSRRGGDDVVWNVDQPNQLIHDKIELTVVRRVVEAPTDKGFGFQELIRITEGPFVRAAFIKRRYRRAYDETGTNRVVEGLEIVKTFRVLDGVAGTEFPTSTTKSTIRMTRPPA